MFCKAGFGESKLRHANGVFALFFLLNNLKLIWRINFENICQIQKPLNSVDENSLL